MQREVEALEDEKKSLVTEFANNHQSGQNFAAWTSHIPSRPFVDGG